MKKHRSGIPKLSGRRPKGHGVRGGDPFLAGEEDEFDYFGGEEGTEEYTTKVQKTKPPKTGTIDKNSPIDELNEVEYKEVMEFMKAYEALIESEDEEKFYWDESEYDVSEDRKRAEMLEKLREEAKRDADGNWVVEVDDDVFDMFEGEEVDGKSENMAQGGKEKSSQSQDDDFEFVMDAMGIKGSTKPPGPEYDRVLPLQLSGPTMTDFVTSMFHHPTKYGSVHYENPHKESTREPVPDLPPQRMNPPKEFVEGHMRFIYVWGLPPLTMDGKPGDLDNPLHCHEMQKTVGNLFDVNTAQVSVASSTSAFVGFSEYEDFKFAVAVGPVERVIEGPVTITKYDGEEKLSISKDSPDSLVLLQNLPSGYSPSLLASSLFAEDTEVGQVYGNFSPEDVVMLSPNSAVVRFGSAEMVESAVNSSMVQERLIEVGQHRIRYSKARRELVYTGLHGGPANIHRLRALGPRLIVDGDMPTKKFFLSHASAIHLRNLDPSLSKRDISDFFQPFCTVKRDFAGSVEFVTCQQGLPTGRAFVGFDEFGEAEAALEALTSSGRIRGLGGNVIIAKMVKEANKVSREKRQTRTEDELLDSLNNWQQYVDPEDLEVLAANDISIETLDEVFRTIRYKNPTFSSLDQAMRSEAINPEKDEGGMFKELVQQYIDTLISCLATPENPGPVYDSLFFEGEEKDTSFFEREATRQAELKDKRKVP